MSGYKTWIAVIGLTVLGIYELLQGNVEKAFSYFMSALGLLGIGHKIEKNARV